MCIMQHCPSKAGQPSQRGEAELYLELESASAPGSLWDLSVSEHNERMSIALPLRVNSKDTG